MCVSLENIELLPEQRDSARRQIRERAYERWSKDGSPPSDGIVYWLDAEREWIGRNYVPPRPLETNVDKR
jgi:hypothetical protein